MCKQSDKPVAYGDPGEAKTYYANPGPERMCKLIDEEISRLTKLQIFWQGLLSNQAADNV